jgi:hypothetical protein
VLQYFETAGGVTSLEECPFGCLSEESVTFDLLNINKNESTFSINEEWIVSSVDEIASWTE